jgi:hypothetical protein
MGYFGRVIGGGMGREELEPRAVQSFNCIVVLIF